MDLREFQTRQGYLVTPWWEAETETDTHSSDAVVPGKAKFQVSVISSHFSA